MTASSAQLPSKSDWAELKIEEIQLPPYYSKLEGIELDEPLDEKKKELPFYSKEKRTVTEWHTSFGVFFKRKGKVSLLGTGRLIQGVETKVNICVERNTKTPYAVKTQRDHPVLHKRVEMEHKILDELHRLKGHFTVPSSSKSYQKTHTFMNLELGVDLFELWNEIYNQKLCNISQRRLMEICIQILCKVRDFHALGYWHRDIKPENFLYDFISKQVSLMDFDTAIRHGEKDSAYRDVGTSQFKPTNIGELHNEGFEVFALGKTLGSILCCCRDEERNIVPLEWINEFAKPGKNWTGIQNIQMLREVVTFLHSMTGDKEDRPLLRECIMFFERRRKKACEISEENILLFDVAKFINASAEEKLKYLEKMTTKHEIIFYDTSEKGFTQEQLKQLRKELQEKRQELQNKRIIFHGTVYRKAGAEPQELIDAIKTKFKEQGRNFEVYPSPVCSHEERPAVLREILSSIKITPRV